MKTLSAVAAVVLSSLVIAPATVSAEAVEIIQGRHRTRGAVIQATSRGTFILTCKHSRSAQDGWSASSLLGRGAIKGEHTALDPRCDLALLFTRQRWPGLVTPLAMEDSDAERLPMRFISHPTLPKPWPMGCLLYEVDGILQPGHSGSPLLVNGQQHGVLWGSDLLDGKSYYIPRESVIRFLKNVQW